MERQRGVALVAALWVLTLLAIVAASFTIDVRTKAKLAHNLVANAEAEALAEAGINRAILELLTPETDGLLSPEIETLLTLAPEPVPVARRRLEGILRRDLDRAFHPAIDEMFRQRWRADGTVYGFAFGAGEARVSIHAEGGKIDVNKATDELLRGLFAVAGLDEAAGRALVDAVIDFRDRDHLRRLNGAEDADYDLAGLPHGAKDRPFETVEELRQVIGVTRELYDRLAPLVTVYSGTERIELATAPREVLLALPGVGEADIEALLAARSSAGPSAAVPGIERYVSENPALAYTIRAEARTASGSVFVREAVVTLSSDAARPYHVRAWKQGTATPVPRD